MASLDSAPARESSLSTPRAPLSPEQRDERLAAEAAAVEAAFTLLSAGQIDDARDLLSPLADDALDTRTLTTLARIDTIQGHFDAAFDLLQRAEQLDRTDTKVLYFTAELLKLRRRHVEELQYRRRLAYSVADGPAEHFVPLLTAIVKATPKGKQPSLPEVKLAMDRIRPATHLSDQARIEATRAIFDIKSLAAEAQAMYAEVDPPEEGQHDVVARWMTLQDWCRAKSAPLHRTLEHGESGRRPSVAELTDAIVHPGLQWMPILDNGSTVLSRFASSRIRLRSEDPHSPMLLAGVNRALVRLPNDMPVVDGPVLLLGGNGLYYHDLVEYTAALAVADTLGMADEVKLLVSDALAPHQAELLALLGISESRLVRCDSRSPVRVRHLMVATRLAAGGRWFDPLLPQWYRRRLVGQSGASKAHRKLYLSRSGTSRRRIINEAEVAQMLESLGYDCIRPETMSVQAQVSLFAQAEHIVGSSGAALTNMMFSPPGAQVLVLQNRHLVEGGGDLYFDALAIACGHRPQTLACTPVQMTATQRAIDADLVVDVGALRALLQ